MSAEEFIEKLKKALKQDGDFPSAAKIVNQLLTLCNDKNTTAEALAQVILKEPSLGTRILHIVNSALYSRGMPITTMNQAVVRLGMKTLGELCASLVLIRKFMPAVRAGGAFESVFKHSLLTSLIMPLVASELNKNDPRAREMNQITGSLASLGLLLSAFYFPAVYDSVVGRMKTKGVTLDKAVLAVTGFTPQTLSIEIIDALGLPPTYSLLLRAAAEETPLASAPQGPQQTIAAALNSANVIAEAIVFGDRAALAQVLIELTERYHVAPDVYRQALQRLSPIFDEHCALLDMNFMSLPDYVVSYGKGRGGGTFMTQMVSFNEMHKMFIDEVRRSVDSKESTSSVMLSVMEVLAWGFRFDRVLLMLAEPTGASLIGSMYLGAKNMDASSVIRNIKGEDTPESRAFVTGQPVIDGAPILEEGKGAVFIPIGYQKRARGIIYADRTTEDRLPDDEERASLQLLCDLLDESTKTAAST